jgi:hypothetical protein
MKAQAAKQPPQQRPALKERLDQARAEEKAQASSVPALTPGADGAVTLPGDVWARVKSLAQLGERAERGDLVEKGELVELVTKGEREREQLEQAMAHVAALADQLQQALRQTDQAAAEPQPRASVEDGRLLAMAAALRRRALPRSAGVR